MGIRLIDIFEQIFHFEVLLGVRKPKMYSIEPTSGGQNISYTLIQTQYLL